MNPCPHCAAMPDFPHRPWCKAVVIAVDLSDRIKAYLEDRPADGGHSDAAGGNAWELLEEAMHELRSLKKS